MIRLVTLAAVAAFIALPAAAESIHVSTAGKSAEQVKLEVTKAAQTLCIRENMGSIYALEQTRVCIDNTVRETLSQASDPALKLAAR